MSPGVDPKDGLAVRIELQRSRPPAGKVAIVNGGVEMLRIWTGGNSWGDGALSFQCDGARIASLPQVYTRNVPAFIELNPGGTHDVPFDLGDGSWEPRPTAASGRTLTAVFEIFDSAEARDHHVWVGCIRSDPVELH